MLTCRTGALALLALLSVPAAVQSQSPAADAMAERAKARLKGLRAEAQALLAQERTLLNELRRLQVERSLKLEELGQIEADAARIEEELASTTRHMELLQAQQAEQAPRLRARLREVYKLGSGGYLRLLLGVDQPRDLGRALRIVSAIAALDRERVRAHQSTLQSLSEARSDLERRRADLARLKAEAVAARAALDRAVRERAALIDSIDRRRDLNAQLTGELQAAYTRLQQTMSGLGSGVGPPLPLRTLQGTLDWPAAGRVTARFGRSRTSRFGAGAIRRGIELSPPAGSPVRAIHSGTVAHAAPFTGFGNLVILDHGNRALSVYGHLDELQVDKGARIEAGTIVGTVGVNARGEPSLYFELRVDGEPVDPLQWLKPRSP
ncbi:MAG TPA: peptidoglycan DD-metalloendopeptidase family protein [Vicinamibacterales bacterium]|nr:peptidoglycan DD-metalloendopeptidase family protein [Vicinamibacterales bacterium]